LRDKRKKIPDYKRDLTAYNKHITTSKSPNKLVGELNTIVPINY